jgi:hypothetical protein
MSDWQLYRQGPAPSNLLINFSVMLSVIIEVGSVTLAVEQIRLIYVEPESLRYTFVLLFSLLVVTELKKVLNNLSFLGQKIKFPIITMLNVAVIRQCSFVISHHTYLRHGTESFMRN